MSNDRGAPWPVTFEGMSDADPGPAGRGDPARPDSGLNLITRQGWRRQVSLLLAVLAAGVVLAVGWRLLLPVSTRLGDTQESRAAVDGTLALLGLLAGALTAGFVLLRPGCHPLQRTLTAILGSVAASMLAWQLGDLLGHPALRAVGAAFVWPVATATLLFLGALLPGTSQRLQPAPSCGDD